MTKFINKNCSKNVLLILATLMFLGACRRQSVPYEDTPTTHNLPPKTNFPAKKTNEEPKTLTKVEFPKREFRAAWIATVDNIDWPSRKGLSSESQQQEFRKILDFHKKTGINAVMVQVRAASDAFYAKSVEPWSEWLTGVQGNAPEPYYDPLRFMIVEAHQRNIEFHAWLNMNRGTHRTAKSIAQDHITNTNPDWFLTYGGAKLYNLGIPEVRDYVVGIAINIVKNYDIDGIHFDDYFYPYTIQGEKLNDEETFKKYRNGFSKIEDWRRNNIDLVIEAISKAIKTQKPYLKFGISPFSVWRNKSNDPNGSDTQGGQTSYDNLYADTKKWLKNGWVDYMAPQIYFSFESDKVPYKTMTDWWRRYNYNRHIYIGQATYKVDAKSTEKAWRNPAQIPNQIRFNRSTKEVSGSIFFSTKSLINNQLGIADSLQKLYAATALTPTMPWKDKIAPNPPKNVSARRIADLGVVITWELPDEAKDGEEVNSFVVYRFDEYEKVNLENPARIQQIVRNEGILNYVDKNIQIGKSYIYVVTALDRLQNESPASEEIKLNH